MQEQINREIIEDVAIELGISPSFIEKDFYAVKILNELSGFYYENARFVFTGGTCLSKGYGLIKRFSEDIDFRILTTVSFNRKARKQFRQFVIDKLKQVKYIEVLENTLEKQNESKFFSFYIKYPKIFNIDNSLRNDLKLEFTFEEVLLPTNKCEIESILAKYINDTAKMKMECVSPTEIAANKFSALLWRTDINDRNKKSEIKEYDATIMRHLHDLAALEHLILNDDFIKSVQQSFDVDKGRGGSSKDILLSEFSEKTLNKLKSDKVYSKEYKEFVDALSYAKEDETIGFINALLSFERMVYFIQTNL